MRIVSGWGKYQTAEEMEINRKYEYGPEFVPLLCQWLCPSPRPSSVVVDVGCGNGYFTKIMGRCMKGQGEIIGIDPDRRLVQEQKRFARERVFRTFDFMLETLGKSH